MMMWNDMGIYFAAVCVVLGPYLAKGCSHGVTTMIANPGEYTTVVATNSERACTTSWTEAKTHVFISDCDTDDKIVVVFGDVKDALKMGGSENGKWTVTIRCHHSPEIVETVYRNSPLDSDTRETSIFLPAVSESASLESECIWLLMVWLSLKLF